jgi:hypothetical protein
MKITIATRESRLALWQAEHVKALLEALGHTVHLLGMTTKGDQILDRSLSKVGGKGLFVKELEVALEEGRADIAVHSLKDVPMDLPPGFVLACVMEREDPRDAWVSPACSGLSDLPPDAVVGTSSLRRLVLLREALTAWGARTFASNPCVATSIPDCESWTRVSTTPLCWPRQVSSAWDWLSVSAMFLNRWSRCLQQGKAHWASRCVPTGMT